MTPPISTCLLLRIPLFCLFPPSRAQPLSLPRPGFLRVPCSLVIIPSLGGGDPLFWFCIRHRPGLSSFDLRWVPWSPSSSTFPAPARSHAWPPLHLLALQIRAPSLCFLLVPSEDPLFLLSGVGPLHGGAEHSRSLFFPSSAPSLVVSPPETELASS